MKKRYKKRTLADRLYKGNVLPDGNLFAVSPADLVIQKLENPTFEDTDEKNKLT